MADKTFTVAGTSVLKGELTLRFANGIERVKVLQQNGHTDIKLIQLPDAMTKLEAVKFLKEHSDFQDASTQFIIDEFVAGLEKKTAPKTAKPKAVKAEPKPEPVAEQADDDEPYVPVIDDTTEEAAVAEGAAELQQL